MRSPRSSRLPIAALVFAALLLPALARTADPPAKLKTFEIGSGPTLVFVHDLGQSRMTMMPLARKLISKYHVVLVDLPGHGESPMPENFSLEGAAAALDPVLAAQKADSTVLVGRGIGGLVALLETRAHPERIKGLVLINSAGRIGMKVPDQDRKQFLELMDTQYDGFLKMMYTQAGVDSAEGVAMHAAATNVPKVSMMAYFREMLSTEASLKPETWKTPALALVPDRVWSLTPDSTVTAKSLGFDGLPLLTIRGFGSKGPSPVATSPDSLAAVISQFASGVVAKKK